MYDCSFKKMLSRAMQRRSDTACQGAGLDPSPFLHAYGTMHCPGMQGDPIALSGGATALCGGRESLEALGAGCRPSASSPLGAGCRWSPPPSVPGSWRPSSRPPRLPTSTQAGLAWAPHCGCRWSLPALSAALACMLQGLQDLSAGWGDARGSHILQEHRVAVQWMSCLTGLQCVCHVSPGTSQRTC